MIDLDLFTKHEDVDRLVMITRNTRSDGIYAKYPYMMEISEDKPLIPDAPPIATHFFRGINGWHFHEVAYHVAYLIKKGIRLLVRIEDVPDLDQDLFNHVVSGHLERDFE